MSRIECPQCGQSFYGVPKDGNLCPLCGGSLDADARPAAAPTVEIRAPLERETEIPVARPPDMPQSGVAAGVLMVLAGPCSLGLTTTDPSNPSALAMLTLIVAFAAAAYSFTKKPKIALVLTWIYVVITGIFAFTGLAVHPVAFLLRGGIGCVLAICAVFSLRKATGCSKCGEVFELYDMSEEGNRPRSIPSSRQRQDKEEPVAEYNTKLLKKPRTTKLKVMICLSACLLALLVLLIWYLTQPTSRLKTIHPGDDIVLARDNGQEYLFELIAKGSQFPEPAITNMSDEPLRISCELVAYFDKNWNMVVVFSIQDYESPWWIPPASSSGRPRGTEGQRIIDEGLGFVFVCDISRATILPHQRHLPTLRKDLPWNSEMKFLVANRATESVPSRPQGIMGTNCSLTAVRPQGQRKRAEQALRAVEAHMSTYIASSELSQLNDAPAGKAMPLSPDTMAVLRVSRQLNEQTGGAFDVTCQPMFRLWGEAGKANRLPTDAMLAAARAKCGWDKWKLLDDGAVKSVEGASMGLGGVAKGWAIDRAVEAMMAAGCPGGLVNVGGDVRCFGRPAHKGKWIVGVQNPFNSDGEFFGTLALDGAGVCTSGSYNRFIEIDGKRYSRIVDPRTGRCVDFTPSVTVVAPTAAIADGWATALSVLGPEGFKLLDANSGIEAMIVVGGRTDYRIHETPGFAKLLATPIPRSRAATKASTGFSGDLPAGR